MKEQEKRRDIIYYISRFDPERDEGPHVEEYIVHVVPGMTVLDGLHQIKHEQDATLAWRFSCRMGVCGSCAMLVNGKPMLTCNTQILDVSDTALTLAPLPNFEVIRDLVPDLNSLFDRHVAVEPYIQRDDKEEMDTPTGQCFQSPHELETFLQFTYCIKCGCCMAACPGVATDREFLGPMALAQAYRYNKDSRDDGQENRNKAVTSPHGVFSCHYAGECSNVCPKGVDPARAIQLMKKELVLGYLKLKPKKKPAKVVGPPMGETKPKVEAPAYTVEQ